MHHISSIWIAGVLFVGMLGAIEVGLRIGLRLKATQTDAAKGHIGAVQASFFGVLALLLGFTFSLSLSRFDNQSQAAVDEANAIGTAYLRADLLPEADRHEAKGLLGSYLDLRVRSSEIPLDHETELAATIAESDRLQDAIWDLARRAAAERPDPVIFGFVQSVNDMIDALGRREAALKRHLAQTVLYLLFGTLPMAGLILGYASGIAGHRPSFVAYVLVLLIVVFVFMIIDLDRPRRGLIRVDNTSLTDLQAAIEASAE
jgi:hypothetical protein